MWFTISLKNSAANKDLLLELKRSLEKQLGKNNVQILTQQPQPGQMGLGIENIAAFLNKDVISKVKTFIAKFTQLKKVELTLINAKGEKLELSASMDKEVMYMLLNGFFERAVIDPQNFANLLKPADHPRHVNPKKNKRLMPKPTQKRKKSAATKTKTPKNTQPQKTKKRATPKRSSKVKTNSD